MLNINCLIAQTFNRNINVWDKYDDNLIGITQLLNGNYIGYGSIAPSLLIPNANIGREYTQIYMLNNEGDTLYTKQYDFNGTTFGACQAYYSIQDIYGNMYFVGEFVDSVEQCTDGYVFKTDSFGNIIWFVNIDAGRCDKPVNIMLDSDSNLLILGYYYTDTVWESNATYIIKLDTSGNFLWQKDYYGLGQGIGYFYCYAWEKLFDGSYLLSGAFR